MKAETSKTLENWAQKLPSTILAHSIGQNKLKKKQNPALSPGVGNWTPSLDRRRDNALWQMGTWNQRSSLWKNYAIQRPKLHNHQEKKCVSV